MNYLETTLEWAPETIHFRVTHTERPQIASESSVHIKPGLIQDICLSLSSLSFVAGFVAGCSNFVCFTEIAVAKTANIFYSHFHLFLLDVIIKCVIWWLTLQHIVIHIYTHYPNNLYSFASLESWMRKAIVFVSGSASFPRARTFPVSPRAPVSLFATSISPQHPETAQKWWSMSICLPLLGHTPAPFHSDAPIYGRTIYINRCHAHYFADQLY